MIQKIGRFRRILRTRETERDLVKAELERHREREDEVSRRIDELEREHAEALADFAGAAGRALSLRELWCGRQRIACIEESVSRKQEELASVRSAILETEARLLERHRDVRILENYVVRLEDAHRVEILKGEQALLDDLGSTRSARVREVST